MLSCSEELSNEEAEIAVQVINEEGAVATVVTATGLKDTQWKLSGYEEAATGKYRLLRAPTARRASH